MRRGRNHLIALVVGVTGCGIPYGGDFLSPRWDPDGEHIYYLEQRFIMGPHPYEYFRLFRASPDRQDRDKIDSGAIDGPERESGSMSPSPDGRYLLYVGGSTPGRRLVVYEVARGREALEIEFPDHHPMSAGWHPGGQGVFYTDAEGIRLAPLDGAAPQLLVRGRHYGKAWSADGRLVFYASGNGWGDGNELRALDVATGESREVASVASGLIGSVARSPAGDRIAFGVFLIEGKRSSIQVAEIAGGAATEWLQVPSKWIQEIFWAEPAGTLLLGIEEEDGRRAVIACAGSDRVLRVLASDPRDFAFGWDYHLRSGRLVRTHPEYREFVTSAFAGCDASLPPF